MATQRLRLDIRYHASKDVLNCRFDNRTIPSLGVSPADDDGVVLMYDERSMKGLGFEIIGLLEAKERFIPLVYDPDAPIDLDPSVDPHIHVGLDRPRNRLKLNFRNVDPAPSFVIERIEGRDWGHVELVTFSIPEAAPAYGSDPSCKSRSKNRR